MLDFLILIASVTLVLGSMLNVVSSYHVTQNVDDKRSAIVYVIIAWVGLLGAACLAYYGLG